MNYICPHCKQNESPTAVSWCKNCKETQYLEERRLRRRLNAKKGISLEERVKLRAEINAIKYAEYKEVHKKVNKP